MLSIIIPTLNEEKYLPRLLASIKSQDFKKLEVIVSDGGSVDRTKEIALENGCLFVEDQKHQHPSWQRNKGAEQAQGELLLFLDADTVLQVGFLTRAVAEFRQRQLGGAGFYFTFNPNHWSYSLFASVANNFARLRQYFSPVSVGAALLVQRKLHEKIAGFDIKIRLAEDYDYCERLAKQGKFRMIKSQRLWYSSRRIKKDGWWPTAYAWSKMALYTLFNKKIKHDKIKYDFGKY